MRDALPPKEHAEVRIALFDTDIKEDDYKNTNEYFFKGGIIMLEVTHSAEKELLEYFKGKEITPIRIFLNESG